MPDGTVVTNVPDDITQSDLLARYTKAAQPAATPQQTAAPAPQSDKPAGMLPHAHEARPPILSADFGMGARQVIDAGAQMLTRGLESAANKFAPGSDVAQWLQGQRQHVEDVNQQALDDYNARYTPEARPGTGIARAVGQMAVTAPLTAVKAAASLPAVIGQGAGIGGLASALTPVYGQPQDFWRQKAGQAASGATTGALTSLGFGLAGRMLAPNVRPEAQAMLDAGVTPTPGQILGGGFKTTEEKLSSVPVLGDAIRSAQTKGLDEYNVALYNRILGNIGEKYSGPAGQQGIAAVGDKLSAAYEDALAKSVPNVVTPQFRASMQQLSGMVPQALRQDFVDTVNRELQVTPGNTLTPSVAKDAESALGRLARQYKGSAVASERVLANAYEQAQASLRDLVAQNNPQIAPRLQAINKGWSDLVQLENAANSTKVARNAGVVTPADQLRGIKRSDYSVRDRSFARGEMPNQDFAQAADAVLANKYPDSGSIGRLLMGGGLLTGGYMAEPHTLGLATVATLPYLPGGRQAMAALLARRPDAAGPAGQLVTSLAPYAGALKGLLGQ